MVSTQENRPVENLGPSLLCSSRLSTFIMILFGTLIFTVQRICINFALVCMVGHGKVYDNNTNENWIDNMISHTNSSHDLIKNELSINSTQCETEEEDDNFNEVGEFDWSKDVQGAILGSFYIGYIFTQVLGGVLSDKFGGRTMYILNLFVLSILTAITPWCARLGSSFLFANRLLMGLAHGPAMPAMNVLTVRWAPSLERAFLVSIAYGGLSIGIAMVFPFSAQIYVMFGWEYIFYITAAFGFFWCFIALFTIYDWPEQHPRISIEEKKYIEKNRSVTFGDSKRKLAVPWKKIFLSWRINVIHIVHFFSSFSFNTCISFLPMFINETLHLNIRKNGFYSSFPYICMMILHLFSGKIFDIMRKMDFCTITVLRKIFNTFGMVLAAASLFLIATIVCENFASTIIIIGLVHSFVEFAFMGGYFFSIFELAPRYSGVLSGITNTFGVLTGFLSPIIVTWLTKNKTAEEWHLVFYIAGGSYLFGAIVYLLFGSSEEQPWAVPSTKKENETEMKPLK